MESRQTTRLLPQIGLVFLLVEGVIFGGVALLCLLGGELTRLSYLNGLFLAGALIMGLGALVIFGNRSRVHPASRAAENLNLNMELMKEHVRHAQAINEDIWSLGPLVALAGLLPIVASVALSLVSF
ncbi:MAG: hypothetical protein U0694_13520 [Anaerolineae bacterium]